MNRKILALLLLAAAHANAANLYFATEPVEASDYFNNPDYQRFAETCDYQVNIQTDVRKAKTNRPKIDAQLTTTTHPSRKSSKNSLSTASKNSTKKAATKNRCAVPATTTKPATPRITSAITGRWSSSGFPSAHIRAAHTASPAPPTTSSMKTTTA